jgi:anti-sigma regulatory factor (Ser/Thr protein kinase)
MCLEESQRLQGTATSPGLARRYVSSRLSELLPVTESTEEFVARATLVVSELVTNAVNAGGSAIDVALSVHRDLVRLTVSDDAAGRAVVLTPSESDDHGRGLIMMQGVSPEWGVDYREGHKDIWVDMPLGPTLSTSVACSLGEG